MFWIAAIAIAVAICFIQLGALSVWVAVLSLGLKVVLTLAVGVALFFAIPYGWRRYRRTKQ